MTATAPKSRSNSLRQLIQDADPGFEKDKRNEPAYELSNGRGFKQPANLYGTGT